MMRKTTALAAALWILGAATANASEQSKILYSRGLVEVAAERDQEALRLFDAAVAADPADATALYYRGVTRGRLGDTDGAIADLEAALRHRPEFPRASFELGVALLRAERNAEALALLEQARSDADISSRATLFAGIAHLRLGDLDAADALLAEAGLADDQEVASTYYRGVLAHQRGHRLRARTLMAEVLAAAPDGATAAEARALLDELGSEPPPYRLSAFGGYQYDSNVLLAPTSGALADDLRISGEADSRTVLGASARWTPRRTDFGRFQLGYDFHQSLHFDLDDFDIQSHGVGGDIAGAYRAFDWGVYGWYDFHFLAGEKFLSRLTFLPWLGWRANEHWRTEVSARVRNDDFYGDEFGVRDASHGLFGLRQFANLTPERFGWIGYRYDTVDAASDGIDSRRFEFDAHEIEAGVHWEVVPRVVLEADYAYRNERYAPASRVRFDGGAGLLSRRRDDVHRGQVAVRLDLSEHFSLVQGISIADSRSTQDVFQYERIVGSVVLEARL